MLAIEDELCIPNKIYSFCQIRLYDVRAQRRPVMQESWMEEPIQALSTCSRDWHVLAGNNLGELGAFDLRSSNKSTLKQIINFDCNIGEIYSPF
jgi:hypothetical protein